MKITLDIANDCANVLLVEPVRGIDVRLSADVWACVDGDELTALEIIDTTVFGAPFDEAAAERAVAWARERLAGRAAG